MEVHYREPNRAAIRPNPVFRRIGGAIAFSLALLLVSPALATGAPAATSSPAAQLPRAVAEFRTSMTAQLDSYFKDYGDRLSSKERVEINALRTQVDRDLIALNSKTKLTARLEARKAPARQRIAAARAAARTFDSTYDRAMAGLQHVQPILQPKLSLFEAFGAKSDLDEQLSRFEELGMRIHQVAGN